MKVCPLCGSEKIKLTDVQDHRDTLTNKKGAGIRLYCPDCKHAMTVAGTLATTAEKVEG